MKYLGEEYYGKEVILDLHNCDPATFNRKYIEEYFVQLKRISKNQIVWGGNYMTEYLSPSRCWLIWDKMQKFTGADFEMAWTSFEI